MRKKYSAFFLLVAFLANCTGSIRSAHLKGSWQTIEDSAYSKDNLYDSIIFTPPNIMSIYFIDGSRIVDSLKAQYIVEPKEKLIKTISKGGAFTFKILALRQDFMEFENIKTSAITKLRRIQ